MRRKVRIVDDRLPDEPPAQLRLPPAHLTYVNPMELFQHALQVAGVVRKDGRAHAGFLVFCARCGAYYWQRAQALLAPCGARGKQVGGAGQQLKRIRELKFPSGLPAYNHLELQRPVRLSGPRAALVQVQLELLAGKTFAGARAPERRRHVKSSDISLAEFPGAPPHSLACRLQLLEAYGLSNATLGLLVQLERDTRAAKAEWRANQPRAVSKEDLQRQQEEQAEDAGY